MSEVFSQIIKDYGQNLGTMTFRPLLQDETSNGSNKGTIAKNLKVIEERLVAVGTNRLVFYIVFKIQGAYKFSLKRR